MTYRDKHTNWTRISTYMICGPKFGSLSAVALKSWINILTWSVQQQTDGYLPARPGFWYGIGAAKQPKRIISELIERGIIEEVEAPEKWAFWGAVYHLTDFEQHVVPPVTRRKSVRKQLSTKTRYLVLERDEFRCGGCGRDAKMDGVVLHVDHVVAVSKGGTNDLQNLQALCEDCNLGKAAR